MKAEKILIVENESIIAKDLELSLKKLGWLNCSITYTGEAAIARAMEEQPDIILMDIKLGSGMDGIESAQQIAAFSEVPVIYLTAYTDDDVLKRAKGTHPYGYIVKPFEERNLQVTIDMALYKHNVEKQLQEKDKWLERIIENLEEGLIAVDSSLMVQLMNPTAEVHTGWSKDDAAGRPVDEIFNIKDRFSGDPVTLPFLAAISRGTVIPLTPGTVLQSDRGSGVIIAGKCVPVTEKDGNISGAMLVFHDITRREKLERRLRQAQKMEAIGTLTGGIAHDFNNLLSVILGYSELTLNSLANDTDSKTYHSVNQVLTAARRARELVKQILAFSRQSEEPKKAIHFAPLVKEVLKLLRSSFPSNIEIRQDIKAVDSKVLADPTQLYQILMNLCTNAAYAMKESGGILDVRLTETRIEDDDPSPAGNLTPGTYLKLSVADTGNGMESAVLERIFEPFYTTKPRDEGTGMGLSVVHGIVEGHHGGIDVNSRPGQGSTFEILLPLAQKTIPEICKKPESLQGGNETILFVDDEQTLVELGIELLSTLGYNIVGRTHSLTALEDFRAAPDTFDMAIVDLAMPEMTGTELAQRFTQIRNDLPIVLCTGFSNAIAIKEARDIGIRNIIMKPLIIKEIAPLIRSLLDKKTGTAIQGV